MSAIHNTQRASSTRRLAGVAFAFGAALAYGASQVIIRHSVEGVASPLVGSLIALACGTLGFAVISARSLGDSRGNLRRGAAFFAAAGIFSALGVLMMFQALGRAQVVVVSPLVATNPLFTLLFAAALLRGVEHITPRIVLGALLVVAGVAVLALA